MTVDDFEKVGVHSLEGLKIRCGCFYAMVRNGICGECGKKIRVINEE